MSGPKHRIDATLKAMERAHRATADEQIAQFAQSVAEAQVAFKQFADTQENEQAPPSSGHSLYALVEAEQSSSVLLDQRLEDVKERLAAMERKRMLALGAMTRLSEDEAVEELKRIKDHVLSVALRAPLRADFIVHGHNIGLSIFRLFQAAERAEAEVRALIDAKNALDQTDDT